MKYPNRRSAARAAGRLWWTALAACLCCGLSFGCREPQSVVHESGQPPADSRGVADPVAVADPAAPAEPAAVAVEAVRTGSAVTVVDRLGRRVHFPNFPQRIVSLSPSLTEILFAIGAGERLVGATQHCDYPPAAQRVPRVGGGTLESLNQESIVALEPDLVLCKGDSHEPLVRNLERLRIAALALGPETLAELEGHTRMLGELTGQAEHAEALVDSMERRIAAVVERIPEGESPMVFYQVWDEPLMTAGPSSYIGELLELAGARNLFAESDIRYPKVSPEAVVAGNPDVILAPESHATPVTVRSILSRPGWSAVRAVQENRVYVIDRNHISRCGPRLIDALEEIVDVLYREHSAKSEQDAAPQPGRDAAP